MASPMDLETVPEAQLTDADISDDGHWLDGISIATPRAPSRSQSFEHQLQADINVDQVRSHWQVNLE